jgi:hypothetical protein
VARALGRGLARPRARGPPRPEQRDRLADRGGVRAQLGEEGAEHARARLRVGQRAVHALDLDAERVGERGEPAAPLQRRQAPGEGDRAQHGRVGPGERRAVERLAQYPRVEARGVGDQHAPAHARGELGQHPLGRRSGVDHRLGDPREALDAARQRLRDADQGAPALVQLAAADEHGADLGQLAEVLAEAVGLRVDGEELGGQQGMLGRRGHVPCFLRPAPDAVHVGVQAGMLRTCSGEGSTEGSHWHSSPSPAAAVATTTPTGRGRPRRST